LARKWLMAMLVRCTFMASVTNRFLQALENIVMQLLRP
jgi:hypothetical protein